MIRPNVKLDEFVVMPNHFHSLVSISDPRRVVLHTPSEKFRSPSQTLGSIVRGFKAATTKRINELRGLSNDVVWQRNYYEHVVRDESELERIRQYIADNPLQWRFDRENPEKRVERFVFADMPQDSSTMRIISMS